MRFNPSTVHSPRLSFHRRGSPETAFHSPSSAGAMLSDSTSTSTSSYSSSSVLLRPLLTAAVLFAFVSLSCFVLFRASDAGRIRRPNFSGASSSRFSYVFPFVADDGPPDSNENKLETVLKDAAMEDGTVILTTLNEAWAVPNSVVDLFLESFRIGDHTRRLLNHLVIIALDQKAFARCLVVHTHCFALVTEEVDFSKEAYFMTSDYLKMMWRRIDFLRSVLEMGYNFVFTDADIMWFRDPFPRFYEDADFQIACDHFCGDSIDLENNTPNGGFNFVKSNNRSIEFYKFWYSSRENYPGLHDQDVLNNIKYDYFITEIDLKIKFLNTAYFGGFCEPSKDLNYVCTMHANCCFGLDSKVHDLRILLEDWKQFMSLPPTMKRLSMLSWRAPKNCSIASRRHFEPPGEEDVEQEG